MNWNAYRAVQTAVQAIDADYAARRKVQRRVASKPSRFKATVRRASRCVITKPADRSVG